MTARPGGGERGRAYCRALDGPPSGGQGRRERLGVDDGERLHRPGEGDVEEPAAPLVGVDRARLHHHDGVELEALRLGRVEERDGAGQAARGRRSRSRPRRRARASATGSRQRSGHDDARPMTRRAARSRTSRGGARPAGRRRSAGTSSGRGRRGAPTGRPARRGPPSGSRRLATSRIGRGHAVAELELLDRRGGGRAEVHDGVVPARLGAGRGGLGEVAEHGHRPGRAAAGDGPQLHGREVLRLVHDRVAVGAADAVEERLGLVDQHQLGQRPRLVVEALGARRPQEERAARRRRGARRRPRRGPAGW